MADLQHYGVRGMKWGVRKGGRSVTVGPGVRGAVKEIGGLIKDATKDDIARTIALANKIASAIRSKSPSVRSSEDHKTAHTLKKKPINELSNDEIRKITTRLQLEKQLKDISAADKARGRQFLKGILSNKFTNDLIASAIKGAAAAARKRREERDLGG